MRTVNEGVYPETFRIQPWTISSHRSPGRYYNFLQNPELIRTSLEEFRPYDRYTGVQSFYELIEWLNGPESPFETNDSRLTNHMSVNRQRNLADKDFVSIVEFCYFFRDLRLNLAKDSSLWAILRESKQIDEAAISIRPNEYSRNYIKNLLAIVERSSGNTWPQMIGVGTASLEYDDAPVPTRAKLGTEFVIRAWLWGNTEPEVFDGLANVVSILRPAILKALPR